MRKAFPKEAAYLAGAIAITVASAYLFSKFEFLRQLGYAGAFLISLISSASVLFPVPGVAVVFAMASYLDPLLLGIAAGIGSGLGEISGYMAGYAGHRVVENAKTYRLHKEKIEKYGAAAIFALALLPNPAFDLAGIAAGALRMPAWKFLLSAMAGKVIRYVAIAYIGEAAAPYF
ncbi:MAG: VTT domain-containing protein [Candidatus Micrarchaeota archaeon]|nr:VTT domain-containing protein [Candidatus Micrarchaeota archaeon]